MRGQAGCEGTSQGVRENSRACSWGRGGGERGRSSSRDYLSQQASPLHIGPGSARGRSGVRKQSVYFRPPPPQAEGRVSRAAGRGGPAQPWTGSWGESGGGARRARRKGAPQAAPVRTSYRAGEGRPGSGRGREGSREQVRGRAGSGPAAGLRPSARAGAASGAGPGPVKAYLAGCRAAGRGRTELCSPVSAGNLLLQEITLMPAEDGQREKEPLSNSASVRGRGRRWCAQRYAGGRRRRVGSISTGPGPGSPSLGVCWACWRLDQRAGRRHVLHKLFYLPVLFSSFLFLFFFFFFLLTF